MGTSPRKDHETTRRGVIAALTALAVIAGGGAASWASSSEPDGAPEAVVRAPSSGFESPWPGAAYSDDGFDDATWFHQSAATEDQWRQWRLGGNANNRDADLGRIYVAVTQPDAAATGLDGTAVKIAFNRWENNGTASFRVELNQVENTGVVPIRTAGDLLLLFNQTGGDVPAVAGAYTWTGTAWRLAPDGPGSFLTSRQTSTVSELEIDVAALFAAQTGRAACTTGFAVANLRTATSKDFDAQLKDWAAPVPLTTPATCEATVEVTKLVQPWDAQTPAPAGGWTFTASGAAQEFPLASAGTAVTGQDGVATAGAARSFVLRANDPDATGTLTVAERLPDGWTMESVTCGSAEVAANPADGSFTISGIRTDDAISCTVVNRAPAPLGATATLAGTLVREYAWDVDKSVDPGDDVLKGRPGEGHELTYTVTVAARELPESRLEATSTVTIDNPSPVPRSLEGVEILLGGTAPTSVRTDAGPVSLDAHTVVDPESEIVLTVTWELDTPPGPAALTMTVPGGDGPTTITRIEDWESDGRVNIETRHRTAALTDDFPELAQQWDAIVTALGAPGRQMDALDAHDHLDGVDYVYTAVRGERVEPGRCEVFGNVATLTVPDGEATWAEARSTVCVGADLTVGTAVVYDIQRTVLWDLRKHVDGETTVPATTDPDGRPVADVDYVVQVTPTITDSAWQVSGTVTVTNPNPWPVRAQLTQRPELGDAVTGCWFADPHDAAAQPTVLDVVLPAAPGEPGAAGDPAELQVEYACQVEGRPDELDGRNVVVLEWESGQDPTAPDAAWSAHGSATASADLAAVTPTFSFLNTDITVLDDHAIDGQAVELGTSNWRDGPFEFRYTVTVPGPQIPDTEVTHVNRAWIEGLPGAQDEVEVTVIAYDLALRVWISEVWRDGVLVFDRYPDPTHTGPDYTIPHVTFDHDGIDIEVGDLLVHDIHLFNQGTRTARIDELVNHSAAGMDYAGDEWMDLVPGHDNEHWEPSADGELLLASIPDGIVLAPGETAEIHLTLRVTEDALPDDDLDHADHFTFVEISAFSGWVPREAEPVPVTPSEALAFRDVFAVPSLGAPSLAAPSLVATTSSAVMHDDVAGAWSDAVLDIDSTPDRENGATADDNVTLVFHSWEDNEIHETNTSMLWDDDENDHDNDEDDHDGAIVRVVRSASPPELEGGPDPTPGPTVSPGPTPTPGPTSPGPQDPEPTPGPTTDPTAGPTTDPTAPDPTPGPIAPPAPPGPGPTLVAAPVPPASPPPPGPSPAPTPVAAPVSVLPRTGSALAGLLLAAGALTGLGALMVRRHRASRE